MRGRKRDGDEVPSVTDTREGLSDRQRPRIRRYLWMMGACVLLIVLAWNVVRLWSTTWAVVMSVVAMLIPPAAAILANSGDSGG
jgi:hypothetical protein